MDRAHLNPVRVLVRGCRAFRRARRDVDAWHPDRPDPRQRARHLSLRRSSTSIGSDGWTGPASHRHAGRRCSGAIRPRRAALAPQPVPRASQRRRDLPRSCPTGSPTAIRANDDPSRGARACSTAAKARYYHGGDSAGVIDRLPYLKDLGVTALWLNPVYDNSDRLNEREHVRRRSHHRLSRLRRRGLLRGRRALRRPRDVPRAGGPAHALGIKVIQDQVANHSGPYHPWVSDSPTPTWFNGTDAQHLANTWQTWTLMDPDVAPTRSKRRRSTAGSSTSCPTSTRTTRRCARYIIQNTLWWMGVTGLDGIRQDTLPVRAARGSGATGWRAIKREYPSIRVVGEVFDGRSGARRRSSRAARAAVRRRRLRHRHRCSTSRSSTRSASAFAEGKPLREVVDDAGPAITSTRIPRVLVTFLGSHDVPRFMNEPGATADGLQLAFTFLLTARGTPLVYYGDEIAMPGGGDPDNRRDFPGGWPGDPRNAFDPAAPPRRGTSGLRARAVADAAAARSRGAAARSSHPPLRSRIRPTCSPAAPARDTAIVAINNGGAPATLSVDVAPAGLEDGRQLVWRVGQGDPSPCRRGVSACRLADVRLGCSSRFPDEWTDHCRRVPLRATRRKDSACRPG